jgi:hypothetical protein
MRCWVIFSVVYEVCMMGSFVGFLLMRMGGPGPRYRRSPVG